MTTETNQDESSQPPFQFGDVVRHQSGDVIKVEACKRVVAHSHLRWAVYDANGNRFWARNCGLVERPKIQDGENGVVLHEQDSANPPSYFRRDDRDATPVKVGSPLEHQVDLDLEPGTINDQGAFVGISEITGEAVHATQLETEIETLAKQRDEAREELKEATAEFVWALSAAHSERDTARRVAEYERASAIGWREVVAKCERIFKMNGRTPTDPNDSAVPLQLDHCLKSLALAENVIRDASKVLARKAT